MKHRKRTWFLTFALKSRSIDSIRSLTNEQEQEHEVIRKKNKQQQLLSGLLSVSTQETLLVLYSIGPAEEAGLIKTLSSRLSLFLTSHLIKQSVTAPQM